MPPIHIGQDPKVLPRVPAKFCMLLPLLLQSPKPHDKRETLKSQEELKLEGTIALMEVFWDCNYYF